MFLKICGITREEDLSAVSAAGAEYAGFVLASVSPRRVSPETARRLIAAARKLGLKTVCVVRDMEQGALHALLADLRPDVVQLHGAETPEYASSIRTAEVWKAFDLKSEAAFESAVSFPCSVIVADSGGGTGKPCSWELASSLAEIRPVMLAGGINPENAAHAVRTVRPWGLDVSSGVELAPGIKDHSKIHLLSERMKK